MRIVNLEQNSRDWQVWRNKGLGASDGPTVMGVSPWTTPFQLWLEKTGLAERPPANEYAIAAMKRGHDLEPVVREMFEKSHGPFPAISAMHDEFDYIRASFDGYNAEQNAILEIKCPNKVDHGKALAGKVPDKYYPQLQQQFMVSGAAKGYYVSWDGKSPGLAVVAVAPDLVYIEALKKALQTFWGRVELVIPPPVSDVDRKNAVKRVVDEQQRLASAINVLNLTLGG